MVMKKKFGLFFPNHQVIRSITFNANGKVKRLFILKTICTEIEPFQGDKIRYRQISNYLTLFRMQSSVFEVNFIRIVRRNDTCVRS